MKTPPSILRQVIHNQQTSDGWERFGGHRRRISELVLGSEHSLGGRLCVLGAGNCNDLDLTRWTDRFREVVLVDLDAEALAAGIARQGLTGHPNITCKAPYDLTGSLAMLPADVRQLSGHEFEALSQRLDTYRPQWDDSSPFDVVLSAGLLTQLFHAVLDPRPLTREILQLVLLIRKQHIDTLLGLTTAGGTLLLITDIVSSTTVEGLGQIEPSLLAARMEQLIADRNFFTGTNPHAIVQTLRDHPKLSGDTADIETLSPWIWPVIEQRCFLVWGVKVRLPR